MSDSRILPGARAALINADGTTKREFYDFFRRLEQVGVDAAQIEALARKLGSPDGTIANIPPITSQQLSAQFPIQLSGGTAIGLNQVLPSLTGDLRGVVLDAWGRVTDSRPVVAGASITIDGTTNPDEIAIINGNPNPMTAVGDLIRGGTSGAPTRIPVGTNGQILTVASGVPEWQTASGLTNPMTTAEDLIKGGVAGAPARLPVGTNGQILTVTAGSVGWATPSGLSNPMTTLGDVITGAASGVPQRLGVGTNGQVLTVVSGAPAWAAAGGGSDPWTYIVLGTTFSTTSITASNVTGMSVSPVADKVIVVEGMFLLSSQGASTGSRPGVSWPTIADGAATISNGFSSASSLVTNGDFSAAVASQTTSAFSGTNPMLINVTMVCGPTPSGQLNITLQSEIAASRADIRAGSWIRYRTIN